MCLAETSSLVGEFSGRFYTYLGYPRDYGPHAYSGSRGRPPEGAGSGGAPSRAGRPNRFQTFWMTRSTRPVRSEAASTGSTRPAWSWVAARAFRARAASCQRARCSALTSSWRIRGAFNMRCFLSFWRSSGATLCCSAWSLLITPLGCRPYVQYAWSRAGRPPRIRRMARKMTRKFLPGWGRSAMMILGGVWWIGGRAPCVLVKENGHESAPYSDL